VRYENLTLVDSKINLILVFEESVALILRVEKKI